MSAPAADGSHRLLLRSLAVARGSTDRELAASVRRGELLRLQRGAYLDELPAVPEQRHRFVVAATLAATSVPSVVSHVSAAVLHRLPVYGVPLGRVHVIRPPRASGSGSARVHLHVARLPGSDVVEVGGLPVTTVTRTVVDVARSVPFESAVVTADAALLTRATTPAQLADCLADMGPVPGSRRAARVLSFADGRSESVGESRSRVVVHDLGLPPPELQACVLGRDGTVVGRVDFLWDDAATVGEFDGRVKYGRLLRPGQSPGDAVYQEKLREDAIRDTGLGVVRWTWRDLATPDVLARRLLAAFARGRRR